MKPEAFIIMGGLMSLKWPEWLHQIRNRNMTCLSFDFDTDENRFLIKTSDKIMDYIPDRIKLTLPDDLPEILKTSKKWQGSFHIRGVLAITEHFVSAASFLTAYLDLPGPGEFASKVARNKALQRQLLPEMSPKHLFCAKGSKIESAKAHFARDLPLILKPPCQSASDGVVYMANSDQITSVIGRAEFPEDTIIEHFIAGQEYSVESIVQDGIIKWSGITQKYTNYSKDWPFLSR